MIIRKRDQGQTSRHEAARCTLHPPPSTLHPVVAADVGTDLPRLDLSQRDAQPGGKRRRPCPEPEIPVTLARSAGEGSSHEGLRPQMATRPRSVRPAMILRWRPRLPLEIPRSRFGLVSLGRGPYLWRAIPRSRFGLVCWDLPWSLSPAPLHPAGPRGGLVRKRKSVTL
jgi:hypothetical protein